MMKHALMVTPLAAADARCSNDVTLLRQRVSLLEQVIEGLGIGVAFCDAQGKTELNSAAVVTLGKTGAQSGLVSADGESSVSWSDMPLLDALNSNEAGAVEFFTDSELLGAQQHLLCSAWPLYGSDGSSVATGAVAILEDITLRERALAQLAASERTLGQALEHANEASRAKSEFLATMSNEIRTPMNSIIGTAEMLTETRLDAQQREYVDLVLNSADKLLTLVNDVLDLSEVVDGAMTVDIRDFDFLSVVSNVVRLFTPMAQSKGIALSYQYHFSLPRRIRGDESKIRQVLINLVCNAIKFTEQGEVCIEIESIEDDLQRYLRLEVRDTGIGIDASQHEIIFDAFQQGEQTSEIENSGTGLGLAICRRFSTLLGGYLGVSSTPETGSSFVFEAPYEAPQTTSVILEPRPCAKRHVDAESLLRVLVVEDNPVNQKLIHLQLETLGHKVKLATSGSAAIERFAIGDYDVVLMSSALPDKPGLEVTRRLRELELREGRQSVPVLGFSANVTPEHRQECRAAGMNGFVGKRSSLATLYNELFKFRQSGTKSRPATVVLNRGTVSELRRLSPEQDFFAEMVKIFWGNATQTIADLRGAARENDTKRAARLCHRLRGACEALGADSFAEACTAMEERCKQVTLEVDDWLERLRDIDEAFAATTTAVQSELARSR